MAILIRAWTNKQTTIIKVEKTAACQATKSCRILHNMLSKDNLQVYLNFVEPHLVTYKLALN